MSEKEKTLLEKIKNMLSILPEEKKEYFSGMVDGIALISQRQDKQKSNTA